MAPKKKSGRPPKPRRPPSTSTRGRPSSYRPECDSIAYQMALLGATDVEIATALEVTEQTVNNWKKAQPTFFEALKAGKVEADATIADALFKRAQGFEAVEEQAIKVKVVEYKDGKRLRETEDVKVVQVRRQYPPDTTAMIFWLKNRRRAEWRDRQDHAVDAESLSAMLAAAGRTASPDKD